MKNFYTVVLCVIGISSMSYAQHGKAWNNWYFGWNASMEFTSGTPVATSGSAMIGMEGTASHSDNQGNLLFYTNGGGDGLAPNGIGGVWNRNHQMMPNGDLNNGVGCSSAAQSSLVIQRGESQYYLFTMGCEPAEGLRESIIDMSLDNGFGDVTISGNHIFGSISQPLAECLTATRHENGYDYWIITHAINSNRFYVFLLTDTGISGPTVYGVGTGDNNKGQMKITPQGDKIAYGQEVFTFDNSTGSIATFGSIGRDTWGRCFSVSGRFLYVSGAIGEGNLYQYDLQSANIAGSEVALSQDNVFTSCMQLGPDQKIYVATLGKSSIGAINSPEILGNSCDFVVNQVPLNDNCQLGVPNFVDSYLLEVQLGLTDHQKEIGMYPNPATNVFNIELEGDFTYVIVDAKGAVIARGDGNATTAVNTTSFQRGVYFVNITADDGIATGKLIVQ